MGKSNTNLLHIRTKCSTWKMDMTLQAINSTACYWWKASQWQKFSFDMAPSNNIWMNIYASEDAAFINILGLDVRGRLPSQRNWWCKEGQHIYIFDILVTKLDWECQRNTICCRWMNDTVGYCFVAVTLSVPPMDSYNTFNHTSCVVSLAPGKWCDWGMQINTHSKAPRAPFTSFNAGLDN